MSESLSNICHSWHPMVVLCSFQNWPSPSWSHGESIIESHPKPFPHSNSRAEIVVKTIKRIIVGNTDSSGRLNTDAFRKVIAISRSLNESALVHVPYHHWKLETMFASKAKLDPRKWDKTGTIIEVKQFDQFGIKVDDSGRVTLRNRKFLRCFTPIIPRIPSSHPSSSPPSFQLTHYPTYQHTQSFLPPLHASPVPPPQTSLPWGLGESATHSVAK